MNIECGPYGCALGGDGAAANFGIPVDEEDTYADPTIISKHIFPMPVSMSSTSLISGTIPTTPGMDDADDDDDDDNMPVSMSSTSTAVSRQ